MLGCPFGTIYEEVLNFKSSQCDFCLPRVTDDKPPLCTTTCPEDAIKYIEIEPNEQENIYEITPNIVAHAIKWILKEPVKQK
jgi:Fe-S-cluster-containing dehydrogenase component